MKTISTTVEYKGGLVKVENGKVYGKAFGTTFYNQKMHESWVEIKLDDLHKDLLNELKTRGLL